MSEEHSAPQSDDGGPFDLVKLRELVEMMEQHGLTEVSLRRGEERWQLRRGPREVLQAAPYSTAPPASASMGASPVAPEQAPPRDEGQIIKSEAVGTFYLAPSPDDPPFVTIGTRVTPDTTVCIIEAMKVFNKIEAGVSGVIAEILVENGDAVEFGTPLFRVRPA